MYANETEIRIAIGGEREVQGACSGGGGEGGAYLRRFVFEFRFIGPHKLLAAYRRSLSAIGRRSLSLPLLPLLLLLLRCLRQSFVA